MSGIRRHSNKSAYEEDTRPCPRPVSEPLEADGIFATLEVDGISNGRIVR